VRPPMGTFAAGHWTLRLRLAAAQGSYQKATGLDRCTQAPLFSPTNLINHALCFRS
jgi:hypothetical protein